MKIIVDEKPKCCADCLFCGVVSQFNKGCTLISRPMSVEEMLDSRIPRPYCPLESFALEHYKH